MNTGTANYRSNFDKIFGSAKADTSAEEPKTYGELEALVQEQSETIKVLRRKLDAAEATLLCFAEARGSEQKAQG